MLLINLKRSKNNAQIAHELAPTILFHQHGPTDDKFWNRVTLVFYRLNSDIMIIENNFESVVQLLGSSSYDMEIVRHKLA